MSSRTYCPPLGTPSHANLSEIAPPVGHRRTSSPPYRKGPSGRRSGVCSRAGTHRSDHTSASSSRSAARDRRKASSSSDRVTRPAATDSSAARIFSCHSSVQKYACDGSCASRGRMGRTLSSAVSRDASASTEGLTSDWKTLLLSTNRHPFRTTQAGRCPPSGVSACCGMLHGTDKLARNTLDSVTHMRPFVMRTEIARLPELFQRRSYAARECRMRWRRHQFAARVRCRRKAS